MSYLIAKGSTYGRILEDRGDMIIMEVPKRFIMLRRKWDREGKARRRAAARAARAQAALVRLRETVGATGGTRQDTEWNLDRGLLSCGTD